MIPIFFSLFFSVVLVKQLQLEDSQIMFFFLIIVSCSYDVVSLHRFGLLVSPNIFRIIFFGKIHTLNESIY